MVSFSNTIITKVRELSSWPWRVIVPVFFLLVAVLYAFLGWGVTARLVLRGYEVEANRLLDEYVRGNPEHEAHINQLRADLGAPAVASKVQLDAEAMREGWPVQRLREYAEEPFTPFDVSLAHLASQTHLRQSPSALQTFVEDYYEVLAPLPTPEARDNVLTVLRRVAESPSNWRIVSAHVAGPFVWSVTRGYPRLWEFYTQNHEWLAEPLFVAMGMLEFSAAGDSNLFEDMPMEETVRWLLDSARQNSGWLQDFPAENERETAFALLVSLTHGHTVRIAVNRHRLPLLETVSVLHANGDYFEPDTHGAERNQALAEANATRLVRIYRNQANVWNHAMEMPYALQLFEDAPQYADAVLERYGNNPAFLIQLYASYDKRDEDGQSLIMSAVAEALARHEDLGAHILAEYRDNDDFKEVLMHPDIGARAVPFVANEPNRLGELLDDPRWVNRYVDENGDMLKDEFWWEDLPGGAIARVGWNMANDVPTTWGELGWAAYDVAKIGKTIGTGGAYAVQAGVQTGVSMGVRSGVQAGARAGARHVAENVAREAGGYVRKQSRDYLLRTLRPEDDEGEEIPAQAPEASSEPFADRAGLLTRAAADGFYVESLQDVLDEDNVLAELSNIHYRSVWRSGGFAAISEELYADGAEEEGTPAQLAATVDQSLGEDSRAAGEYLGKSVQSFIPEEDEQWWTYVLHGVIVLGLGSVAAGSLYVTRWRAVRPA